MQRGQILRDLNWAEPQKKQVVHVSHDGAFDRMFGELARLPVQCKAVHIADAGDVPRKTAADSPLDRNGTVDGFAFRKSRQKRQLRIGVGSKRISLSHLPSQDRLEPSLDALRAFPDVMMLLYVRM